MKKTIQIIMVLYLAVCMGCEEFLDERPRKNLVVPQSIADLQGLLDNSQTGSMNTSPGMWLIGSDDVWTDDLGYASYNTVAERNAYLWKEEVFDTPLSGDWTNPYRQVFASNVVLFESEKIVPSTAEERSRLDNVIGSANFYRAKAFFDLLQVFAPPYEPGGNNTTDGIILRLSPEIDQVLPRSSVGVCYAQVLEDLDLAIEKLPNLPQVFSRPSKASAWAMKARVFLSMEDYAAAENAAMQSLAIKDDLLDLNQIQEGLPFPISQLNIEVLFHSQMINYNFTTNARTFIDSTLIKSYGEHDLRKQVYFLERGPMNYTFRGHFTGSVNAFSGLTVGEVMLTAAEAKVRNGKVADGMGLLNQFLISRYEEGTFEPYSINDPAEALETVLLERRKELVFRGLRWTDLRRLNRDSRFAKTLVREIAGETFQLPPGSNRYVYPIPQEELDYSGVSQNDRSN
jgi:hypothetical protein